MLFDLPYSAPHVGVGSQRGSVPQPQVQQELRGLPRYFFAKDKPSGTGQD